MTRKPTSTATKRRRNAAATREAILASARRAFARSGYDGVGVREIAAGAGVTAMLVNRYFGSKERLFAEVMAATIASPTILTTENLASDELAAIIAKTLVDLTQSDIEPLDGFLITLHSASSERAARIGRKQIQKGHQKNLTAALRGRHAKERAALVLALVAGFQVMRQMIRLDALVESKPAVLVRLLEPLFRQLIEPETSLAPPRASGR